jgi:hypothetical protein
VSKLPEYLPNELPKSGPRNPTKEGDYPSPEYPAETKDEEIPRLTQT